MSTKPQTPGYRDLQRIRTAIDRVGELRPLVEATMRAADGPDWMAARRQRLRQRGIRVRKDQSLRDPRVLLACLAVEEPLASVFSEEERAIAERLRQLANAAAHHDLGSLASDDATWAETSVDRLLQVGRATMPPRQPAGPDVHGWMRHAHDVAREQDEQVAAASHAVLRQRADYFERAWWLQRTLATFHSLMAQAGNPGAALVRPRARDLLAWPLGTPRGWTLAYREAYEPHGHPRELRLVLSTSGALWLCGASAGGRSRVEQAAHVDPRRPRTFVVRRDWSVEAGPQEYVGDRISTGIPFRTGWRAAPDDYAPRSLEEAVAARIGALCVEHGLAWPDDDREASALLAQERLAFQRDPPASTVPSFALQRALVAVSDVLGRLRGIPFWLALPLVFLIVALAPGLAGLLALAGAIRLGAGFLGLLRGRRDPIGWLRRQPRDPRYYVQGCLLLVVVWFAVVMLAAVIKEIV